MGWSGFESFGQREATQGRGTLHGSTAHLVSEGQQGAHPDPQSSWGPAWPWSRKELGRPPPWAEVISTLPPGCLLSAYEAGRAWAETT